jgi:hypothetical protein
VNGCREKTKGESEGTAHRRDLLIGAKSGTLTPRTTHLVEAHSSPTDLSVVNHSLSYRVACSRFSVALARLVRACTHTHRRDTHKRASPKTHTRVHTQDGMLHTSEAPTSERIHSACCLGAGFNFNF